RCGKKWDRSLRLRGERAGSRGLFTNANVLEMRLPAAGRTETMPCGHREPARPARKRPGQPAQPFSQVWPPRRGSAREPAGASSLLFVGDLRLGLDHLLATVVAVGSDVVADVGFAGGRIGRQLLAGQRIVGATHATLGRGNAGLLDSHGLTPGKTLKTSVDGPAKNYFDESGLFFNADSAANGLARSSSASSAGQSRSIASVPGFTGITGMARINSSSTSSTGFSMPSSGISNAS